MKPSSSSFTSTLRRLFQWHPAAANHNHAFFNRFSGRFEGSLVHIAIADTGDDDAFRALLTLR